MNITVRKIELLANIAIIAVALLLGSILVKRHFLTNSTGGAGRTKPNGQIRAGAKLFLPSVDWAKNGQTLLLALTQGCHYCSESAPFYRRLARELRGRGQVRLIAVLPQSVDDSQKYLNDLDVAVDEVRQASLTSIGVIGAPTLILVNNAGVVTDVWLGRLKSRQESEVLSRLRINDDHRVIGLDRAATNSDDAIVNIEGADLKRVIDGGQRVIVLDVRNRANYTQEHIAGAKNIPVDELEVRATYELPRSDLIVTYSSYAEDDLSKAAYQILNDQGFRHISVLRGGLSGWQRAGLPTVTGIQ